MRIAIPEVNGKLCMHFGHCPQFVMVDVDVDSKKVVKTEVIPAPPHEPGLLPKWLSDRLVDVVIAGGMGQRAQRLFAEKYITVLVGAPSDSIETLVVIYLNDRLVTGVNVCDH
jgi:predicted Fe-Mo cluster-binding NifX family protein